MKALELLYQYQQADEIAGGYLSKSLEEAIEELEAYITNYQGINRRLDNTITTLAVLQNENKSLVKILEEMIKEKNELKNENQDLKNRSCENCKHNKGQDNFMIFCDKVMCQDGSKMMWYSFTKDFSCKYWGQDENTTSSIY